MFSGRTIQKIAIVMGVASLVLQILGYSCPGWVVVVVSLEIIGSVSGTVVAGFGEIVSHAAVWYTKICVVGEEYVLCTHKEFHDTRAAGFRLSTTLLEVQQLDWAEIQIVLTLALVFCLMGLVLAIIGLCHNEAMSATLMTSLASAAMLLSWVLILPAIIKVALAIDETERAIELYERDNGSSFTTIRTPWALILSACGLLLALICCVLLLVSSCKQNEKTSGSITPGSLTPRHTPVPPTPSEDQYGGYPFITKHLFMREGTEPHMPPNYNQDILPAIGSKDIAPLEYPQFGLVSFKPRADSLEDNGAEMLPASKPPLDTALIQSKQSTKPITTVGVKKHIKIVQTRDKLAKDDKRTNDRGSVIEKRRVENGTGGLSIGFIRKNNRKDGDKHTNRDDSENASQQKDSLGNKSGQENGNQASVEPGPIQPPQVEGVETTTNNVLETNDNTSQTKGKDTGGGLEYV